MLPTKQYNFSPFTPLLSPPRYATDHKYMANKSVN